MNKKILVGLSALTISFASVSFANFNFTLAPNGCSEISGNWAGTGEATNWAVDCVYQGTGVISAVDNIGQFTLDVDVTKNSGSFLCPSHEVQHLTGICVGGKVTIDTGYGDLTGNVTKNTGTAKGNIHIAPGVNADVTIQLQRND